MNIRLAFLAALIVSTAAAVHPGCAATKIEQIRFTLEPAERDGMIRARFRRSDERSDWTTEFNSSEFQGIDLARLRAENGPIHFAIVREAGRLDCDGEGGRAKASGTCDFTFDAGFARLLESRGIGRPSRDEALALMAVDARRSLIDALAEARYPTPSVDKLIPLAAVGVSGNYIEEMAKAGHRPESLDRLIEVKALGISANFINGFASVGYDDLATNELVQLKALNITPAFIAGFQRIGYRKLPVSKLVELKALDVTPEMVRAMGDKSSENLDVVAHRANQR
jgi:hypothetical protein